MTSMTPVLLLTQIYWGQGEQRGLLMLPIRLIDSDGRRLDDEHQTDGSEGHRRLMAIRKKDRRGTECGWASSRRKPEIGGR